MKGERLGAASDLGDFALLGIAATADSWEVKVEVPAGARWFDGHFPGHPILPAVAQLALVDRLLRRLAGPGRTTALDRFRLPLPVAPGDRLAVALARPDAAGRAAFTLRRGTAVVSGGTGEWTPLGPAPAAGAAPAGVAPATDPAAGATAEVAGLLPHRGPALLARRIVERDAGGLLCAGTIPPASPLAEGADGAFPAFAAVELAAQAAGLHEILRTAGAGGAAPSLGYLVRIRAAAFAAADLPAGSPLLARVDREAGAPPLALYRFDVAIAGARIAQSSLGTYAAGSGRGE